MLLKTYFVTNSEEITLTNNFGGNWYVNVQAGIGGTIHVEAKEFNSYQEAFEYVNDKYQLGI